jgi:hypothetical protein
MMDGGVLCLLNPDTETLHPVQDHETETVNGETAHFSVCGTVQVGDDGVRIVSTSVAQVRDGDITCGRCQQQVTLEET